MGRKSGFFSIQYACRNVKLSYIYFNLQKLG
jgi:hypothetical protein